jgi:uncharacterized protein (DUF433 family)
MLIPDFLTENKGEILLRGHRVGLFHVVTRYNDGFSAEMIVCQYPTLPLALIHKVIAFYLENRQEVDAYVQNCDASLEEFRRKDARKIDFAALRARMADFRTAAGVTSADTE